MKTTVRREVIMFIDIMMAFIMAMVIELFSFFDKGFKHFIICFYCIAIIAMYFIFDNQINFIGKIDFEIWIIFVVLFNNIITIGTSKLIKCVKG